MYDVIVAGARCAGSPTAMLLARKGYRVLLVDRATFPSDTISGHFIQLPGVRALYRWGLLAPVLATECPVVLGRTLHREREPPLVDDAPPPPDVPVEVGPRRTVLDTLLVEAAIQAGVEVREHLTVEDVLWDDGRVRGIQGRTRTDNRGVETARLVVGADGKHSVVARAVHADVRDEVPRRTSGYYTYWADLSLHGVEGGRSRT